MNEAVSRPVARFGSLFTAYALYSDELVRFATGMVGHENAADVVADAVSRLSRRRTDWTEIENDRAFLYRTVLNEANSWRRRLATRNRSYPQSGLGKSESSDGTDRVVSSVVVQRSLDRLSPQQRAVVVLTYWQDLLPREVAARLGISEGSVKKQLSRARAKLRKELS